MANPEHTPHLDGFDRSTVRLYRIGLALASLGVGASAGTHALGRAPAIPMLMILAGTLLAVLDMHLYDKRIRWIIHGSALLGAVLCAAGPILHPIVGLAGLGFLFVALSGFALKEQFCFRVPLLRAVPLFLAASLVPMVAGWPRAAAPFLALASGPLLILCVAKFRMPLHFDIGDKSRYQV